LVATGSDDSVDIRSRFADQGKASATHQLTSIDSPERIMSADELAIPPDAGSLPV
jgi:hypothetical protein